jgi:hypothetical protein
MAITTKPSLLALLIFSPLLWAAHDMAAPYQPTRAEWLELYSYKASEELLTAWSNFVAISTRYFEDNTLLVTLASRNGQPLLEERFKREYEELVLATIERAISKYPWAKGVKVHVMFSGP